MRHVNSNLITLKIVLFFFFGGVGCLFPFLPLHMSDKGFTVEEKRIISLVAPAIAILGPAIAGPLADKLALRSNGKPYTKPKKYLRIMIALCFILSAVFYWLLMAIPAIERCKILTIDSSQCSDNLLNTRRDMNYLLPEQPNRHDTSLSLVCKGDTAEIIAPKCYSERSCDQWGGDRFAHFYVSNCTYICESEAYHHHSHRPPSPPQDISESTSEYDSEYDETKIGSDETPIEPNLRRKRDIINTTLLQIPHPHLCYKTTANDKNETLCEVFSIYSRPLRVVDLPIRQALNDTEQSDICRYPLSGDFHCRLGPRYQGNRTVDLTNSCNPVIKCDVENPAHQNNSVLLQEHCVSETDRSSFWWYLFVRGIADIFPAAAVALLDSAIIIATRETSLGRGDAGKQFAAAALGFAIFAPVAGAIDSRIAEVALFSIFLLIAALIMIVDGNMPLSPPEWWWHTRCGLLAMPMASIRKYGLEIAGLTFVVLLLGVFWNGVDSFLSWHIVDIAGSPLDIGLTITIGALPAVIIFIYIENILDYCGHPNLLIITFTFYIVYYAVLSCVHQPWLLLLCKCLDIFNLHIMWVTVVLYFRHLIPRKFTVSGQALLVIVHFCIARIIGTLLGGLAFPRTEDSVEQVYQGFAIAAAIVAVLYFLIYHLVLKPRYVAPVVELEGASPVLIQSVNGNGTYTPLRVYHNSKALKGQFKY